MNTQFEELANCLQNESIERRVEAAQQLATLGIDAAPLALSLLAASDSDNESLREWSTAALETCGAPQHRDLSQLVDYIQPNSGASKHVIYWALTLIGRMESEAQAACNQVCKFIEYNANEYGADPLNTSLRTNLLRAVWTIAKIANEESRALQVLKSLKKDFPVFDTQIQRSIDNLES